VKPLGFGNKVLPIQHLKAVLFSRGQMQLTINAFAQILMLPQLRTIEDVAEALPAMLRKLTDMYCAQMGIPGRRSLSMLELTLAGWSEAKQRMQAFQYYNVSDYVPISNGDIPLALHTCPILPKQFVPATLKGSVRENLIALVKALGKSFEADPQYAGCRVGGDVVETIITPDGISQQAVHRLAGYEQDAVAGAAVYARMERGDIDVQQAVREGLHGDAAGPANDKAEPAPPPAAQLSRQQRRAAQRAAAKAGSRAA
jgi:hypothetical protein